ncbi:hypothetical protein ACFVAJ_18770 [Agromyces sp. NPDC057679]|uniref:hypothetical protein n=1 Tax=Agromyces sp. NPDC057679 TaxID=3346207 RepID=UPI003671259E
MNPAYTISLIAVYGALLAVNLFATIRMANWSLRKDARKRRAAAIVVHVSGVLSAGAIWLVVAADWRPVGIVAASIWTVAVAGRILLDVDWTKPKRAHD